MSFLQKPFLIASCTALALLSGCITVLPETEPPTHLVRMPTGDRTTPGELDQRVLIHQPDATGALAGAEIAAIRDGGLVYINNVRWADAPSRQLQSALVDRLSEATGNGWAATMESGARGEFELHWSIRDLAFDMDANEAVCDLRLTLLAVKTRNVVASDRIRTTAPTTGRSDAARANAVANAMSEASDIAAEFVVNYATSYNLPIQRNPRRDDAPRDERRNDREAPPTLEDASAT